MKRMLGLILSLTLAGAFAAGSDGSDRPILAAQRSPPRDEGVSRLPRIGR